MVAASAASSHKASEEPRLAGDHTPTAVVVAPTHSELADKLTVGIAFTVVAKVLAVPLQPLTEGVTVTLPEVVPTVTVTELVVVPAVCVHPAGKVQL
jgi:hypothetical protein